jgi:hypothetical protein
MDENEWIGGDYLKGGIGFEIHGQNARFYKDFRGGERGREGGEGERGGGGR